MAGASFNRGGSKQDYSTPAAFISAVEYKFGKLDCDLAANDDGSNAKAPNWIGPTQNSLKTEWPDGLRLWLNPPFNDIAPWVTKCSLHMHRHDPGMILCLVPASVGSDWYRQFVHKQSTVYFLNGRLSFDGRNPYPKDCMLVAYSRLSIKMPSHNVWAWRKDVQLSPLEQESAIAADRQRRIAKQKSKKIIEVD